MKIEPLSDTEVKEIEKSYDESPQIVFSLRRELRHLLLLDRLLASWPADCAGAKRVH